MSQGSDAQASLPLWVIYAHPSDFPGYFVLRCQTASARGVEISEPRWIGHTAEEVRAFLPADAYPLGRQPGDDPAILEVWV